MDEQCTPLSEATAPRPARGVAPKFAMGTLFYGMLRPRTCFSIVLLLFVVGVAAPTRGVAQLGLGQRTAPAADTVGAVSPGSPRAALEAFLRYGDAGKWDAAADFLSVPVRERDRAPELARRLRAVIDQRLALNLGAVSPLAAGDTTDGDLGGDRIGVLTSASGPDDVLRMVRVSTNPSRWAFSQATVGMVDAWYATLGTPWLRDRLPAALNREGPLNVYWWQWIGLVAAIPLLIAIAWVLGAVLRSVLGRLASRTVTHWDDLLLENLRGPFRLWAAAIAAGPLLSQLQLNARVSALVDASSRGFGFIALFWALLRVIRLTQGRLENAAWEVGQGAQARTLVPLLGNFLRVAVIIVALLVALAQFGYPVGTLLAGLGIGGIAVALAAQKTVEHMFGSISLAADKAFRVGDWVRAGTTEGTVERIGLRSTSIRTMERTVVRVPNGRLADERIETFGERDRILLKTFLDVTYDTGPAQLTRIQMRVEALLRAHPKVWPDTIRVYVIAFTDSAIRFEVVAWFLTTEWIEFLQIRHDLFLALMQIVEEEGSSFAFPSRTVYHVTEASTPRLPE